MVSDGMIGGLAIIIGIILGLTFLAGIIVIFAMMFMTFILHVNFGVFDFWLYTAILSIIFNVIAFMVLYESLR